MKKIIFIIVLIFTVTNLFATANSIVPNSLFSETTLLNSNWMYLEKDTNLIPTISDSMYQIIDLPHTWNATDALQTKKYRQAGSWYRKHLTISKQDLSKRIYLRFGAAGQQAKVFINSKEISQHKGGYSAFVCELTDSIKLNDNVIDVWVSNKIDNNIPPLSGDFNFYGGLYRSVELIKAPLLSVSRKYNGGPGLKVWSEKVNAEKSDLNISVTIDNGDKRNKNITVVAQLIDKDGKIVSVGKKVQLINSSTVQTVEFSMNELLKPLLWSPENPQLYQVKLQLFDGKKVVDEVKTNYGFRWFEFTADKGFLLNGKPYKLKGLNRHQDYYKKGNALPLSQHLEDIQLMKELGVNWVRLAHYQQDDYVLQLCDQLGLLVWEEVPYVNKTTYNTEFTTNLQTMLRELIHQHFNHTSIILWGMGNEVGIKDRGDGKSNNYDLVTSLNKLIHDEDPVRKSVFVSSDVDYGWKLKVMAIPDVIGYNLYRGWYKDDYNSLTKRLNELHSFNPDKPMILSEFGADADIRVHTENPTRQDYSIEYQNDFIQSHLDQIAKIDWLCGSNWWSFANFGAAERGFTMPHLNQKGLVTFDRKKKDSFYIVKSRYNTVAELYLESPFWTERTGLLPKIYRVFTNMDEVELFLNGKSLGSKKDAFYWNVVLEEGENILLAKGIRGKERREHGFSVFYSAKIADCLVKANIEDSIHTAKQAIDKNYNTRWSADGETLFSVDLTKIEWVSGITIAFYKSSDKSYALEINVSKDGVNWEKQFDGSSNKHSIVETFMFDKQKNIRYIQIVGKGNNIDNNNSYVEFEPVVTLLKQK